MFSSRNSDLILSVFSDTRSVFSLNDIAKLIGKSDIKKLNERLNYYVRRGKLLRPRKVSIISLTQIICLNFKLITASKSIFDFLCQKYYELLKFYTFEANL